MLSVDIFSPQITQINTDFLIIQLSQVKSSIIPLVKGVGGCSIGWVQTKDTPLLMAKPRVHPPGPLHKGDE